MTSTNGLSSVSCELRDGQELESIVGRSRAMCEVLRRIVMIAPTDATVPITGESGTGKKLVANATHANSNRANAPSVTVNCAAVTATLLESELFGHIGGSFTGARAARKGMFEEAEERTLVLDEIAEPTTSFQAKLLRALQERELRRVGAAKSTTVGVRINASTKDLPHLIQHRCSLIVGRIALPPLRARREDIPLLAELFLERFRRRYDVRDCVGDGVFDASVERDFAGNVRELENVFGQAVALARNGVIHRDDLPLARPSASKSKSRRTLADLVESAERRPIENALHQAGEARDRATEPLGLSPAR